MKFADQPPRIGDWVVAVGNPFGLGGTVTAGIVSARGRDIGAGPYDDYVQIDAPINKGNSGGPAFDMNGNVIGVNTAIFSPSGGSVGIGFDIPAATAKLVVNQLKDKGYVTRGWLGVQVQPVTADIADSLGLKQARGAMVDNPQAGSPAAKAGIEAGDVITAVNGADGQGFARSRPQHQHDGAGKLGEARCSAQGRSQTADRDARRNAERPSGQCRRGSRRTKPRARRISACSLAPAAEVEGAGHKGVVVTAVDPDGPAAEHGFKTGDVILNVGGKTVANVGDVRSALNRPRPTASTAC